jgi:hypothetical protein
MIYLDIVWLLTALINPGIKRPNTNNEGDLCDFCLTSNAIEIFRDTSTFHCESCNICIEGYLQHFPLTGNCIGRYNFIAFKMFILGILIWGITFITNLTILSTL